MTESSAGGFTPGSAGPLEYPHRSYGMDHDRYDWSMLVDRPPLAWPNGARLAVWVVVPLQFFPLNPQGLPVKVAGNMTMPYPDLRHYTLRDFGNRVGVHRVLAAVDAAGLVPTFAVNGRLAEREPGLMALVRERGDEVIGHSWSMDTPHAGGLAEADERVLVARTLDALESATGARPTGWVSPGRLNSPVTPDLLAEAGVEWFADWVNDDLPYPFRTRAGELTAMPLPTELADTFVIGDNLHSEASWAEQVADAADLLAGEAAGSGGGRVLGLTIHPWLMGQPHRVRHLRAALEHVSAIPGVWAASGSAIRAAARSQA